VQTGALRLRASAHKHENHRFARLSRRRGEARGGGGCAPPRSCICINCKWVDRCKTYHWVETQHEQEHVTAAPDFEPVDPQIQVFIREEPPPPPPRAPAPSPISPAPSPPQSSGAAAVPAAGEAAVAGEMLRDLTTEFDVFACDAFTEDSGRWLRLMPDAGFVPS